MIQRIQTVYLFISTIIIALLMKLNLADISVADQIYPFNALGIFNGETKVFDGLSLFVLIWIITILHVFVIFKFKKRLLQVRILIFTIILMLGLFGLFFFFAYYGFEGAKAAFKIPVAFPLVAVVLDYMAMRAIGKDEALIKSLNRIR